MKVICAGLPKTGTKSLASALRTLGYNVHDIEEHWKYHLDEYLQALEDLEGKHMPDFAAMYADVDAVTDTPACYFWKEIFDAFPDAKVVLMIRDSEEEWLNSLLKSVATVNSFMSSFRCLCTPTGRKWKRFFQAGRKRLTHGTTGDTVNPDAAIKGYIEHNARVQSSVQRDHLLVYNVKQGWRPLCEFLGVEVPDVPYPRLNVKSADIPGLMKISHMSERMFKELVVMLGLIVLIGAVVVYQVW